ncbi:hypothetical protein ACFE04_021782 [Oxalis oulophora]
MTIRNTAGPQNIQAVALRIEGDRVAFYKSSVEGYQDTVFARIQRQFFRECDIYGTVDFIFGDSVVVFQNCTIYLRNPPSKTNAITAQGRVKREINSAISIHNSLVKAASDLRGRPWMNHSRTVFMKTYLDAIIDPAGWLKWEGKQTPSTIYYGEYMNTGPGSPTTKRVKWKGVRAQMTRSEAISFTVGRLIDGDSWLPANGVPYTSGL